MSQLIGLTGATGFIGRRLVERLTADGFQLRALIRSPASPQNGPAIERVFGDLDSPAAIQSLIADCNTVIHLAGAIAGRDALDFARVNAVGTARLVECMEKFSPGARLIVVSSLAAREPRLSHYAASKRAGELVVESSTLDWFILRPPAVYGPADAALAPLWRMLARGWLLRAGPDLARFSLLHVDDLCSALLALLGRPLMGRQTHSLDDGRPGGYRWRDIAAIGAQARAGRVKIMPVPASLLSSVAWINLHSSRLRATAPILVPGKVRELTHIDWVCDSRLQDALPQWSPQRRLEAALHELPGWR